MLWGSRNRCVLCDMKHRKVLWLFDGGILFKCLGFVWIQRFGWSPDDEKTSVNNMHSYTLLVCTNSNKKQIYTYLLKHTHTHTPTHIHIQTHILACMHNMHVHMHFFFRHNNLLIVNELNCNFLQHYMYMHCINKVNFHSYQTLSNFIELNEEL